MSLIIKGLDMPKGTDGLSITFHSQDGVMETHILDVTQAIQISHPHGRIKDVDNITTQEVFIDEMSFYAVDCDDIDDAPTILEAEK